MRTLVLVDGQNLFHLAKAAWGDHSPYSWPSYDVEKLASALVALQPGRRLSQIRFYTGVPRPNINGFWNGFWNNKLRHLESQGIVVYRGSVNVGGQEKGVDVSLALDLVRATYEQTYDVAIIVSQDSDFGPAVRLSKEIAKNQNAERYFESAFPFSRGNVGPRGVPGTKWVYIDQALYDTCLDPVDYRPRKRRV